MRKEVAMVEEVVAEVAAVAMSERKSGKQWKPGH